MRQISSIMRKINIIEGDTIRVDDISYVVSENGYLCAKDTGEVNTKVTAEVLFGIKPYRTNYLCAINKNEYSLLLLLDKLNYKSIMLYSDKELYVSKLSQSKANEILIKDNKIRGNISDNFLCKSIADVYKVNLYDIEGLKFILNKPFRFYPINFLIKRYKYSVEE